MPSPRTCQGCGGEIGPEAPSGHCGKCLVELGFLDDAATGATASGERPLAPPFPKAKAGALAAESSAQRFGDYELVSKIAEGGMGVVFKARQLSLNRTVALKMIRSGIYASKEFVHRFRVEASAAAVLQHPNIVAVHEVGVHEGQHFFSMDYVAGQNLAQMVSDGPLPSQRAARYVQKIAEAIHYAHQSGILHRDLKPSNVLVDANDQPRITDFGLAKQMDSESAVTLTGDVMGTPGYMPPEQASGNRGAVKAWSDVYSIGAILYHLLTGRAPFAAGTLEETLNQMLHQDPVSLRLLNPVVPRDLDTICLKCLEKEPAKRYGSAQLLADELTRFLQKEPILARPLSSVGKAWRWCRRKPALAVSLFAVGLLVGAVIGISALSAVQQRHLRRQAEASVTRLEIDRAEMLFKDDQSAEALAYLARVLRREPTNRVAAERIISALAYGNFCVALFRLEHKAAITAAEFSPDGQRILTASKDGNAQLWDGRSGQPLLGPFRHHAEVTAARFSPDGRRVATTSLDETAWIWDAQTGQALLGPLPHEQGVLCADFDADGQRLVTGSTGGSMRVWSAATGAPLGPVVEVKEALDFVKFSPDGKRIALAQGGRPRGTGRLVDAVTGQEFMVFALHGSSLAGAPDAFPAFSADGTRVATVSAIGMLNLSWTAPSGAGSATGRSRRVHLNNITCARFSPDGQYLATSSIDTTARIWDADTIQPVGEVMRHGNYVNSIDFSPDGQQVVTGSKDHTARIWDARTGQPLSEPLPHDANVWSAQFSPDGLRILSLCEGPTVWVWEVRSAQPLTASLPHPESVRRAVFSPGGERLATILRDGVRGQGSVRLWDARRAIPLAPPFASGSFHDIQFSADGNRLLTLQGGAKTAAAIVWDCSNGKIASGPFRDTNTISGTVCARFSPDGQLVLMGGGRQVKVWRLETGSLVSELSHQGAVGFAQFSPDGQWVVTTSADKTARLWDWRTGKPKTEPLRHDGAVLWCDVSADSQRAVTISRDKSARVWEARSGKLLHTLPHTAEPYDFNSVQFSPDGGLIGTAAGSAAQIWNSFTGEPVSAPLKHDGRVNSVRFDHDGKRMVTTCNDSAARIWDVSTGHLLSEPLRHPARVIYAEFSPDDRWVVTASDDQTARIWEVPALSSSVPPWLADWAEAVAGQRLDVRHASQSVAFDELRHLRERVVRAANEDEAARWAKWFFADYTARTLSPRSPITVADLVERRTQEDTLESLQQAVRLSPTSALAQARLAFAALTNEAAPTPHQRASSDWQSLRATRYSPNDPEVLWARAEVCERLGRLNEALEMMDRGSNPNPTNPSFWNAWGLMLEKTNRLDDALKAYGKAVELSGPWQGRRTLPALAWNNRSSLLKRLDRLAEAAAANLKAINLAERQAGTPPHLIDLSLYYNRGLDLTGQAFASLTSMPTGGVTLKGVKFDLRGAIQLKGGVAAHDVDTPDSVRGIAIRQKCRRLHFLHFGGIGAGAQDGVRIGVYQMKYVNGHQEVMPIVYGQHVRDLWSTSDPKESLASGTQEAWVGTTPDNQAIRLFLSAWENPLPEEAIESLDFVTSLNRAWPFLLAITAEP